jgi:putative addiction module component (TIGR02574 family)
VIKTKEAIMSIPSALLEQALALPAAERARLANRLLLSLEPNGADPDADHRAAWAAEIEAWLRDVEKGHATLIPWKEVKARLRRIESLEAVPEPA